MKLNFYYMSGLRTNNKIIKVFLCDIIYSLTIKLSFNYTVAPFLM